MPDLLKKDYYRDVRIVDVTKEAGKRRTVGFISTDEVDLDGEIIDQKSLLKAMPAYMDRGGKIFYMHNYWGGVVGNCLRYWKAKTDDGHGVKVESEIGEGYGVLTFLGPTTVDDIWMQIEQGRIKDHSVGVRRDRDMDEKAIEDGTSNIIHVKHMLEYSIVGIGANTGAIFEVAKFLKSAGILRPDAEKFLRDRQDEIEREESALDLSLIQKSVSEAKEALANGSATRLLELVQESRQKIKGA